VPLSQWAKGLPQVYEACDRLREASCALEQELCGFLFAFRALPRFLISRQRRFATWKDAAGKIVFARGITQPLIEASAANMIDDSFDFADNLGSMTFIRTPGILPGQQSNASESVSTWKFYKIHLLSPAAFQLD